MRANAVAEMDADKVERGEGGERDGDKDEEDERTGEEEDAGDKVFARHCSSTAGSQWSMVTVCGAVGVVEYDEHCQ